MPLAGAPPGWRQHFSPAVATGLLQALPSSVGAPQRFPPLLGGGLPAARGLRGVGGGLAGGLGSPKNHAVPAETPSAAPKTTVAVVQLANSTTAAVSTTLATTTEKTANSAPRRGGLRRARRAVGREPEPKSPDPRLMRVDRRRFGAAGVLCTTTSGTLGLARRSARRFRMWSLTRWPTGVRGTSPVNPVGGGGAACFAVFAITKLSRSLIGDRSRIVRAQAIRDTRCHRPHRWGMGHLDVDGISELRKGLQRCWRSGGQTVAC